MWGKRIRKLRDRLGWSQRQLARGAGVHWQTIHDWEHRDTKPHSQAADDFEAWMRSLAASNTAE